LEVKKNILILLLFIIANISNAQWVNVSPGGGGFFMRIGAGPTGIIIACSDLSGAYRSLNHGQTWDCIGSFRGLTRTHTLGVGFDPVNPTVIFVGTDVGLFRSTDTGSTFKNVASGGVWSDIDVSLSNNNICYGAYHPIWNGNNGVIYKSINNGLSWSQVSTGLPSTLRIDKVMVHPTNPNIVYFVSGKSLYSNGTESFWRSIDGGVSWTQLGSSLGNIVDAVFDPTNINTLYVTKVNAVYKSIDAGVTWALSTTTGGRIFLNRQNPLVLRIINTTGLTETLNGGSTWTKKTVVWNQGFTPTWSYEMNAGTLNSLDEDLSNPDAYYWVTQMWVYGSFNGGVNFNPLHTNEIPIGSGWWKGTGINNTEVFDLAISPADHNILYISLWDDGLWHSMDRGETWQSCNNHNYTGSWNGKGGDSWTVLADPTRADVVWAGIGQRGSVGYLVKSTMSGSLNSWVNSGTGLPGPSGVEVWGLSVDTNSPETQRVLFVTVGGAVYKSTNDGSNWSLSLAGASSSTTNADYRSTAVDYFNGQIIWAGGDTKLMLSQDGGATWTNIVGSSGISGVFDIKTDRNHSGWVYVACYGSSKGIYRSKDKGVTWEKLLTDSYARGVAVDPVNSDILYATSSQNYCCGASVSGSTGVSRSLDGGKTWKQENDGLSWPFAFPIEVDPTDRTFVFIGSPGDGFFIRTFTDLPNKINDLNTKTDILIYPNPFNETTTIDFSAVNSSGTEKVSFYLYNLLGSLVVAYNNIEATKLELKRNNLASGIYYYNVLKKNNNIDSGKLNLE
jgi:hypothetical protein